MGLFEYFRPRRHELFDKNDIRKVIENIDRNCFLATTILEEIYKSKRVTDEYRDAHYEDDLGKVMEILNEMVDNGELGRWDVYYQKKDSNERGNENSNLDSVVNHYEKALA